jgi:ABC-type Fe3+-hydroxamate transport system substrate-binding protein
MLYTDQLNRSVQLVAPARRIVSIVPSQTELLYDLGLNTEVVGITKFCVHPPAWRKEKTIVGGTKNLRMEVIDSLQPDLILANKEENQEAHIKLLEKKYPVWVSDISTIQDALHMIKAVGVLTNRETQAAALIAEMEQRRQTFLSTALKRRSAVYLIWREPWMAAGTDTYIHSMLEAAGFANVLGETRYPTLSTKKLRELQPEYVLLSSEPYPFTEVHISEIQALLPQSKIILVDGEMFSWYGSRMLHCWEYFSSL